MAAAFETTSVKSRQVPAQLTTLELTDCHANPLAPNKQVGDVTQLGIENSLRFNNGGTVTMPGQRIRSLVIVNDRGKIIDTVVQNGQVVGDPHRTFRTVTLNLLAGTPAAGGDGYPFFRFVRENSTLANRIDLTGESNVDLNGNGQIDAPVNLAAGRFTFAATGSEQDALAEYLGEIGQFTQADTPDNPQRRRG